MKPSKIRKRSIEIAGRETSISLEKAFWNDLKEIADKRCVTLSALVSEIDSQRQEDPWLHRTSGADLGMFVPAPPSMVLSLLGSSPEGCVLPRSRRARKE